MIFLGGPYVADPCTKANLKRNLQLWSIVCGQIYQVFLEVTISNTIPPTKNQPGELMCVSFHCWTSSLSFDCIWFLLTLTHCRQISSMFVFASSRNIYLTDCFAAMLLNFEMYSLHIPMTGCCGCYRILIWSSNKLQPKMMTPQWRISKISYKR